MRKDILNNYIISEDMRQIYDSCSGLESLKNSSIYITGATGMIGSYLTAFLIWLNEEISYNLNIYISVRNTEKAKYIFGSFCEKDYFHILNNVITEDVPAEINADFIIHGASLASPQYYGYNPVETMLPNIIGTYRLLEYSRKANIKSMVFLSSGSVYGSFENDKLIMEEDYGKMNFLSLGNAYGESKRCGEALCHAYSVEYGVNVMSARINHTYGPTMDIENDSRVFSDFVGNIVERKNIVIKGTGADERSFTYIVDTIAALFTILTKGKSGESYNIANATVSIADLAETLVELFPELNLKVEYQSRNQSGYYSSPEKRTAAVSTEKLKALGWSPMLGIKEGFERTVRSFI